MIGRSFDLTLRRLGPVVIALCGVAVALDDLVVAVYNLKGKS